MPSLRHAFLLNAVRELGRSVPDIARSRASWDACLERIREACVTTLGMEYDTLSRFDARSVVGLFAHPEQARILARLVDERARLCEAHGRYADALADSVYAGQLLMCSRARFGLPRDARAADVLEREAGTPTPLPRPEE
ncbi:hypothetical protein NR800_21335 [Corallococcus interemptor]|uniref:hypothetical protein n=1 Tax=Corallococcus TaxID=83461 RepID=UPI001CBE9663|nr:MULTISPECIES: hypothetical protein [unclassified Corallococcus]MBZ4330386.1 hypothetical protein [Corallococcus sp. AS-1-12]MBZ4373576.1 hypothetical protein [Corallococcus sp. AS-1-6]